MSKLTSLEKLTDKVYRDAFISDEIDVGLPMQLRSMREERDWKQSYVAEKTGTKQPRITLMEKPGYGNFSLNTLKKMASLFDVGLIVSFVPWSEMIDFTEALTNKRLAIPSFADDYDLMQRRYSRAVRAVSSTLQGSFDFPNGTTGLSFPAAIMVTPLTTATETTVNANLLELAYMASIQTEGNAGYVRTT